MDYPFTPLKTYQGLSVEELKILVKERDVYIWGGGFLGRIIKRHLEKNGLVVKSFCDSNPKLQRNYIDNVKVVSPQTVLNFANKKQAFIIIASTEYRDEIEKACMAAGLIKKNDFLSYIHLSRPEALIEVAGRKSYMTASIYRQVLSKLLLELPSLTCIDLSRWNEPFANPNLPEIIQLTETLIPCTLFTNLQISDRLEDVIKAQPSQLIISVSGYGKSYEINHNGASWQIFLDNIHLLKKFIDKYKPKTQITVLYYLYRNNQKQDLDNLRSLCSKLGLKFSTAWAYLNPYDTILDYCKGRNISTQVQKVLDNLSWNVNNCLKFAKADARNPCLCQRIFPIINWDLSVSLCHVYDYPIIAKNFLNTSLKEILKTRHTHSHCVTCQKYGLHRLDIGILLKKYPQKKILLQ